MIDKENGNCDEKAYSDNPNIPVSKGYTTIDIDNVQDVKEEPSYIEAYMQFMYWTCVSPFNPKKYSKCRVAETWFDIALDVVQKVM